LPNRSGGDERVAVAMALEIIEHAQHLGARSRIVVRGKAPEAARYAEVVTEKHAQGPPNLVVEILSPGTRRRDEGLKRRLYERMGVDEYWIVDPTAESVRAYRVVRGVYRATPFARGDTIDTDLLPGLKVGLADVFEMP
jgi:Uma2 family endonuclease